MRKYLIILFAFVGGVVFGQEYKFNIFSQEEGLPQPYVYDIVQGPRGRLYVATGDGLAVFGGTKFQKYTKKNGLAENYCSALFFDSKQRLWIGHFEGGISRKENTIGFEAKKFNTADLPLAKIVSFAEDSKGIIYYASSAGGLYTIKENKIALFTEEELPPINEIKIKDDVLYLATQEGVLYFDLSNRSRSSKNIEATKEKNITCLEISPRNELWLGVDGVGIDLFAKENNEFKALKTFSTELKSERYAVKDICLNGSNELWASFTNEGLCRLRYTSNYGVEKLNTINNKNGLKSLFINRIFIDKEENFWFGSTGAGLFQFLSSRFESYNTNNFLPFDDIRTIAVDDSDNVFVTDDKSAFAFNVNGKVSALHTLILPGVEEEIRTSYLNKLTHELWIGTNKNLNIFNVANNNMVFKNQVPFFKDKSVNYITKNQSNQFLVCTTEGLFYLNDKMEVEKEFTTNDGAPHNNFLSVLVDRTDRMWVFSPETPLYNVYNGEVDLEKTQTDSFSSFRFGGAVQDKDENIWFSTEGDGIFSYKKNRNPKFKHFNTDEGLSSDFIYGIIVSNKGDVIACHKNGISIKYSNLKNFRTINKSTGLPANNVNTNALFKDRKGNIWFGTTEGIIKYTPTEDKININPPVFSFLSISTNSTVQKPDSVYRLKYNKYELVIDFIGVSLTNPKGVSYRYKLEGFEDKFRTTTEQSIVYPSLADGNYRFVIYSKNADGFENPEPTTFRIIIGKPFWKEIWFIILVTLFVVLVIYVIFRMRTRKLQQAKIELEGLVMEKTAELLLEKQKIEKTNELLNEKNSDITASIAYAKRIQNAVLPDKEYISKKLNLFVLYKPRDIVSGDFYWYSETENYAYVAVVDCTGHGVPGAFMSLLGSTFLDQVLIENKEPEPSKILNELDRKLHNAFRKREEENRIGDGMDAIVMRVSKDKREIMFSGANRPVYYYSKEGPKDFKATIYSIGGSFSNDMKGFTDTVLHPEEGDGAYMFSDGFGDQFGGDKNKRYSTKRMKGFFGEIYQQDIDKQFELIDKEFTEWMGGYEQMDDICVIGIKF